MNNKKTILAAKMTLALGLLTLFLLLTKGIMIHKWQRFDAMIEVSVYGLRRLELNQVMLAATFLGSALTIIPLTILGVISLLKKKQVRSAVILMATITMSELTNEFLKVLVNRQRPVENSLIKETNLSFPSGHAMNSAAFYLTMSYLLTKTNKKWRKYLLMAAAILMGIIGFSRLYLGVHYATDVIGGYLMGTFFAVVATSVDDNKNNLTVLDKRSRSKKQNFGG